MRDTVAIVGSHPRTRTEFDFDRADCDVWLFNEALSNPANEWAKRADAVFQMHEEAIWKNPANRNDPHHYNWLTMQTGVTVYMQEQYPQVPRSVAYPLEEVVARFKIRYFTSSVAYALALACLHGYKRIELYGVEMETNTEYQYQRDGVTLWIGVALGMGIEVDAHVGIFDQPLYGYEGEVVLPYETFDARISEIMPEVETLSKQYAAGLMDVQKALRMFVEDGSKDIENALHAAVQRQRALGEQLGRLDGARQENERYKGKADQMRSASAGEFLFSRQEFESGAKTLSDRAGAANVAFISLGTQLDIVHQNIRQSAKGSPKRLKLAEMYGKVVMEYFKANNQQAIFHGAAGENFRYMGILDKHIRAAGGSKSEEVLLERMRNAESLVAA